MEKTISDLGCLCPKIEGELFRNVKNTNGIYWISNYGRLLTLNHRNSGKAKIMKPAKDANGYLRTMIVSNGKLKTIKIHRLVAEAWIENPENKSQVNHIDFDRSNNKANNLEWMTPKENTEYSYKAGRIKKPICTKFVKGSDIGTSILTESQVLEIRSKFKPRVYTREMLGKEYGVAAATIKDIVLRKSWNHI